MTNPCMPSVSHCKPCQCALPKAFIRAHSQVPLAWQAHSSVCLRRSCRTWQARPHIPWRLRRTSARPCGLPNHARPALPIGECPRSGVTPATCEFAQRECAKRDNGQHCTCQKHTAPAVRDPQCVGWRDVGKETMRVHDLSKSPFAQLQRNVTASFMLLPRSMSGSQGVTHETM
jgi:hypothetical protein